MLKSLDDTLIELLRRSLPPELAKISISFALPDREFPPSTVTLPAINFFLYDVRENRELRDREWQVERQNNGAMLRQPPLVRVDCSYLITAWYDKGLSDQAQQEHQLLGEVMEVLLGYPTLPHEVLQGKLQQQELPPPTSVLQAGQLQSLAELWQALDGKPKAGLNYTVTIAVPTGKPIPAGFPVLDSQIAIRQTN